MYYYVANVAYSDELYHWGIKGQKWGIRRFQNEDGSLTKEGKQRYRVNSVGEYRKRQLDSGKSIAETTKSMTGNATDILRKKKNRDAYVVDKSVKKMSDDELRKRINRIQMERQYSFLTSSEKNTGRDKAIEILETTGMVVGIVGGAFGIAASIKNLMGYK